jgi:putative transposase
MGKLKKVTVTLTDKQKQILESLQKGSHTPLHFIQRASILLFYAQGFNPSDIARELKIERITAYKWRTRWNETQPELDRIEQESPWRLKAAMETLLQDAPRPGKPAKFTAEQVAHIIKIACEKPERYGIPLSHWTPSALAREAVNQHIVESISSRQVGRFLKRRGFKTSSEPLLAES